jgi:hypothetical protein
MMNKHQLMMLQLSLKKLKLLLPKRLHQDNKLNKPLLKQLVHVLMKMKTVILMRKHPKLSMKEDIRKELKNV